MDTWLALGENERAYEVIRDREIERLTRQSNVNGTMGHGMYYAKIALVFRDAGDPQADQMMGQADDFYQGRSPEDLPMRNDLIGGALWRLLHADGEGAFLWIHHAVAEGDAFLAHIDESVLDPLVDHPEYSSMMLRMQQNSDRHRNAIEQLQVKTDG